MPSLFPTTPNPIFHSLHNRKNDCMAGTKSMKWNINLIEAYKQLRRGNGDLHAKCFYCLLCFWNIIKINCGKWNVLTWWLVNKSSPWPMRLKFPIHFQDTVITILSHNMGEERSWMHLLYDLNKYLGRHWRYIKNTFHSSWHPFSCHKSNHPPLSPGLECDTNLDDCFIAGSFFNHNKNRSGRILEAKWIVLKKLQFNFSFINVIESY